MRFSKDDEPREMVEVREKYLLSDPNHYKQLADDLMIYEVISSLRSKIAPIEIAPTEITVEDIDKVMEPFTAELVYKPPVMSGDILDETTELGKRYKLAKDLCTETQITKSEKPIEKIKSKATKSRIKKDNPRVQPAPMAAI